MRWELDRSLSQLCWSCGPSVPVQVPYDAGPVSAHAYQDAVWLADEQAGDLLGVPVEMHLRLHLYL